MSYCNCMNKLPTEKRRSQHSAVRYAVSMVRRSGTDKPSGPTLHAIQGIVFSMFMGDKVQMSDMCRDRFEQDPGEAWMYAKGLVTTWLAKDRAYGWNHP